MRNSTFFKLTLVIAVLAISYGVSNAQEVAMPGGFFQHGNNSSNVTVPSEDIDSVTVGSVLQYWAEPDPAIGGASTFTWNISGLGVLGATTTNLATVTYGAGTGTGTLDVEETAPSTPACPGSTTTIDFEVIDAPTADFGADPAAQCYVPGPATLTFTLPITVTTAISGTSPLDGVRVIYTVTDPTSTPIASLTNVTVELPVSTASINVTLPAGSVAGTYTLTISSITDRVSRKPATDIEGTFGAGNNVILMVVNPVPTTGPIFHVPNL